MFLNPNTDQAYQLLHKGTLALTRAEQQGIRIDMEYCEVKKKQLTRKIEKLETSFKESNFYKHWRHSIGGKTPNINSGDQLGYYLYTVKKLKPTTTTKSGKGSTDEEALEQLNIPELNDYLKIKKLKKLRDTYLDAFIREQVNGFIHPFFNLHTVITYRSSSDRPNFQNIPKRDKESMLTVRKALFPRAGNQLLESDFSGIEVCVAACYHKDPTMLKYIFDPTTDMHGDMAKQIFIIDKFDKSIPEYKHLRQAAKNSFVFPQFYGDYYRNCAIGLAGKWGKLPEGKWKAGQGVPMPDGSFLADHLISKDIKSLDDFIEHLKIIEQDFWGNRFKHYARWKERWWKDYQNKGYIDMYTGFRCIGLMNKKNCINYPVQGSAFHCLLWSFIRLDEIMRKEKWQTKIIGQIHDSILFDVFPEELDHVAKTIHRVTHEELPKAFTWINVPMEVEMDLCGIDKSWAELEPYKLT
jgi:DNA polymerase-1